MNFRITTVIAGFILCVALVDSAASQSFAASLRVVSDGVTSQRGGTDGFVDIGSEAIVGIGDTIQTNDTGTAVLTLFEDGIETTILPNTTYVINQLEQNGNSLIIAVEVLAGQTRQRIDRILDSGSSYDVGTPGVDLVARGTRFDVRVEANGRSAMIVSEGMVGATADDDAERVAPGFGVRSELGQELSDVVRATSFDELDAALDGCPGEVVVAGIGNTMLDVQYNVRTAPSLEEPRIGSVLPADVVTLVGTDETGEWFRIPFNGGFGWSQFVQVELNETCAGLRVFTEEEIAAQGE